MLQHKMQYQLCFAEYYWAWFTSVPLSKQWGEDWEKAPYEREAGEPFDHHYVDSDKPGERQRIIPHDLVKVAWDGDFMMPSHGFTNSPYSVNSINAGVVPWFLPGPHKRHDVAIAAGATLKEFIKRVKKVGGTVYFPVEADWYTAYQEFVSGL